MNNSSDESLSKFLYKYRSLGPSAKENTLSIIRDNALWASSPLQFNDPFDCIPFFLMDGIEETIKNRVDQPGYFANNKHYLVKSLDDCTSGYERMYHVWEQILSEVGIISLSGRFDNCLMWSHYADNHKGICIELDPNVEDSYLEECRRVNYNKERPVFYCSPFSYSAHCSILELLFKKSKDWEYEEEWRCLCMSTRGSAGTAVELPLGSITRIIMGAKASDESQEEIEGIVKQSGFNIKVVRARLDDKEYKIVV